jgi:hypothetical protein
MSPFEVYKTYLAFKSHFIKKTYDYHKYCGRSRASLDSFHKRKDRYFFEKISRQKNDEEIKSFFVANFAECNDPERLWIGDIIRNGEDTYSNWLKKSQSLTYLFKTECEVFISKENFENLFDCKNGNHPEILKKYLQKALTLETLVILNMILNYVKDFDKKMNDPVWEMMSLKIQKYQSFINIDVAGYKKILKEIVYE